MVLLANWCFLLNIRISGTEMQIGICFSKSQLKFWKFTTNFEAWMFPFVMTVYCSPCYLQNLFFLKPLFEEWTVFSMYRISPKENSIKEIWIEELNRLFLMNWIEEYFLSDEKWKYFLITIFANISTWANKQILSSSTNFNSFTELLIEGLSPVHLI